MSRSPANKEVAYLTFCLLLRIENWTVGAEERENRCVEEQPIRVEEAWHCACCPLLSCRETSQLCILKTVSFIRCKWLRAGEAAALCLRWMDLDSSTMSEWKPASGLNGFPLLISSSISISVQPFLISHTTSLSLSLSFYCSHFSSTDETTPQSPFQPFYLFFSPFCQIFSPPFWFLSEYSYVGPRCCRKGRQGEKRQLPWCITW